MEHILLGGMRSGITAHGDNTDFIDKCEAVWQNSKSWHRDLTLCPSDSLPRENAVPVVILTEGEPVGGNRVLVVRFDIL
ncbi:MAG TPA: hypothetical protein GX505_08300 [Clostridiales bacterium]|nr:hypothetical protein [Clostridiales bacterium]